MMTLMTDNRFVTRSEVLTWLMVEGGATAPNLVKIFGNQVRDLVGSLRDLGLVDEVVVNGAYQWRPARFYFKYAA